LVEFGRLLPATRLRGLEPSRESARHANLAGVPTWSGFAEELAGEVVGQDLVLSVNVIEHSADPVRFLGSLAAMVRPGGEIVVVCPDGGRPSSELLFFDHLFSITASAFARFVERSGLSVKYSRTAPKGLGDFHLYVLSSDPSESKETSSPDPSLHAARVAYLEAWTRLDAALVARTARAGSVTCFGAGEAALLLRAYAPLAWSRVRRATMDAPAEEDFCGLPIAAFDPFEVAPDEVLLLGVRPADQPRVAERLSRSGVRVVRWDDVVAS
jgi:SAM-dependent methyltransferase